MERILLRSILLILCGYGLFKLVRKFPACANKLSPIRLLVIKGIIIMTTQLLGLGLRKMRQPKVIAEVLGGIVLGTPTPLKLF